MRLNVYRRVPQIRDTNYAVILSEAKDLCICLRCTDL
jgi:hypothetical protein